MSQAANGVPSPTALAAAVRALEQSRDAVLACCAPLPPGAWARSDGPGRWTVAQILEHMLLLETQYLSGPTGLETILAQPPNPHWQAETAGKDAIMATVAEVTAPLTAPEAMQPTGALAPTVLLARFRETRAATLALAARPGLALCAHTRPHRILGTINAYQVLLFMAAHTDRHRQQMHRCLAAPTPGS